MNGGDRGEPTAEELCSGCPALVPELVSRIEALKKTDWIFNDDTADDDADLSLPQHEQIGTFVESVRLPESSLTAGELATAIQQSGLLEESDLASVRGRLATEHSAIDLACELIAVEKLTTFQASSLLRQDGLVLVLGAYEILDRIGAGGMGEVFKARHRRMRREVALKILPPQLTDDEAALKRFSREVRIVASLEHPNIVTAFDAGEQDGTHYLIMQYVEGCDLTTLIRSAGPLSVAKAVEFTLQAARGLVYAHGEGVIHRDIKPSNLLVDKRGRVKILDLGLARVDVPAAEQRDGLTTTGAVMGTVDYMAPEQAVNTRTADHRSDIYSLGCTLHFLLTGKSPYSGETMMECLIAHREKDIPVLQAESERVPEALQAVFEKMLARNPEDRFSSVSEVVTALDSLVADDTGSTQCGKDQPVAIALDQQEEQEDQSREVTLNQSTVNTDPVLETTCITAPQAEGKPGGSGGYVKWISLTLLAAAGGILALSVLMTIRFEGGTIVIEGDPAVLTTARVTVDGEAVQLETDGRTFTLNVDQSSGDLRLVTPGGDELYSDRFTFRTGQKRLPITASLNSELAASVIGSGEPKVQVAEWQPGPADGVLSGLVPRPAKLPGIKRWQAESVAPRGEPSCLAYSPDGQYIAVGSGDQQIRVYEVKSGRLVRLFAGHTARIMSLCWSPDGRWIASGSFRPDNVVRLWNFESSSPGPVLWGHGGSVLSIAWSPDGKLLASGSNDRTVRLWDAQSFQLKNILEGHAHDVTSVTWNPASDRIATGSFDKTVQVWDALSGKQQLLLEQPDAPVLCLGWSPTGKWIAAGF